MATPSLMLSQVTCPLCQKTYSNPLLLPCQHTFCSSCIQESMEEQNTSSTLVCPQCGTSSHHDDCTQDKKTLELMELYESCTEDKKLSSGSKLKLHLHSRLLGSKKDKTKTSQQEGGGSDPKKTANGSLKSSVLRASGGHHTSVCSVVDPDAVLCEVCMKLGAGWMCIKCTHKTCDICRETELLLCKDQTKDHIFMEYENTPADSENSEEERVVDPHPMPTRALPEVNVAGKKQVTFEGIEEMTESSTDIDLPRPNYRDSLALTKDKKERLEDIIQELREMERVGGSRCEALSSYHDYMTEVKVAGFDLLSQTEMLLHDKVKAFFVKLRHDYEQGFDEMTLATEEIHSKMAANLQSIQLNSAILEEIVENNDTRVMMDQEFLDGKCDEVEQSVVALAQNIAQCNGAGLQKSTTEWGPEEKRDFEKTMSRNILEAVGEEMERSMYTELGETVGKLKPKAEEQVWLADKPQQARLKRVSRLLPKDSKNKRKWYDCVIA